jgi:hypothetical protein
MNNTYLFGISQNAPTGSYMLVFWNGGALTWLISWTPSPEINTGLGAWNTMKVVCSGSTISLYINDTLVNSVSDSTFGTGKVGVMPAEVLAGAQVHYDDAHVSLSTLGVVPATIDPDDSLTSGNGGDPLTAR